jgi:hypothetical protein
MTNVIRFLGFEFSFFFQLFLFVRQHNHDFFVMNRSGCDAMKEFSTVAAVNRGERRMNVLVVICQRYIIPKHSTANDAGEAKNLVVTLSCVVDEIMHSAENFLLHAIVT